MIDLDKLRTHIRESILREFDSSDWNDDIPWDERRETMRRNSEEVDAEHDRWMASGRDPVRAQRLKLKQLNAQRYNRMVPAKPFPMTNLELSSSKELEAVMAQATFKQLKEAFDEIEALTDQLNRMSDRGTGGRTREFVADIARKIGANSINRYSQEDLDQFENEMIPLEKKIHILRNAAEDAACAFAERVGVSILEILDMLDHRHYNFYPFGAVDQAKHRESMEWARGLD